MAINYKQCPECGSKKSIKILYGEQNTKVLKDVELGKVKLSKEVLNENSPENFCKDCGCEWSRDEIIEKMYDDIKTIKASVGGHFGSNYQVTLDLVNQQGTWSFQEGVMESTDEKFEIKMSEKEFIDMLKSSDVLKWKSKYIESGEYDGTSWIIEIKTSENNIKKYGDNKFPQEWEVFCEAIKKITNKEFK